MIRSNSSDQALADIVSGAPLKTIADVIAT